MGPFKCQDCGIWWAGFEHRCQPAGVSTETTCPSWVRWTQWPPSYLVTTLGIVCTCPPNRGPNYAGNCPIHDVQVTFTA